MILFNKNCTFDEKNEYSETFSLKNYTKGGVITVTTYSRLIKIENHTSWDKDYTKMEFKLENVTYLKPESERILYLEPT